MEAIQAFSYIIENLEDALLVIDTHGLIRYVNSACIKILDVKENESIFEAFQKDSDLVKLFIEVKDKGTSIKDRDIEISKPRRRKNLFRTVVHPLKDDGENIQVAFILKDLKKIRGLEMSSERTSRLTTMGNLAFTVAHEMKNPLNSMVINMEVLKRIIQNLPKKPGENAQKHIDLIVSEIKRLDKLCKNFLQFVRPPLPDFIEVDLNQLLKDVIFLIEIEALQRGIQIQQEVSASPLHLEGDPDQLAQAFLNLMMNALQAMAEGGTLKVEVESDEDWVEVLIRDNGKGMSPEIREKIFDLYFTTQEGGSGMGLPMARRIFDDHGGSIEVISKEGEGTTFNVWLPLKTDLASNK